MACYCDVLIILYYINIDLWLFCTQESIKDALDKLCLNLPGNMQGECQDFVHTYTDELIEMLIADLKPEEVCVYLKLCTDNKPAKGIPLFVPVVGNVGEYQIQINLSTFLS